MSLVSNTVTDQNGRAIAAAQVTIRDLDGALVDTGTTNPVITNSAGFWSADLDGGTYELVITKGDDFISREQFVCGPTSIAEVRRIFDNPVFSVDINPTISPVPNGSDFYAAWGPFDDVISPTIQTIALCTIS